MTRPLTSHLDIIWSLALQQPKNGSFMALPGGGSRQNAEATDFEPGARDYVIRLWDLNKREVVRRFAGHENNVVSLAFCPDGRHFVSGSWDKTVRLWDLASGKQVRVLGKHDEAVTSVAVSPDGRSCVSGGRTARSASGKSPPAKTPSNRCPNKTGTTERGTGGRLTKWKETPARGDGYLRD